MSHHRTPKVVIRRRKIVDRDVYRDMRQQLAEAEHTEREDQREQQAGRAPS